MRRPDEIIAEMQAEKTKGIKCVCLVVAFEEHNDFILDSDAHALANLTELIETGGDPVGLFGVCGDGMFGFRPLKEHEKEDWIESFLQDVKENVSMIFSKAGYSFFDPKVN